MKKFILSCGLLLMAMTATAKEGWYLVTDSGSSLPIEDVSMLVATDLATNFSVVSKNGAEETIHDVKSVSFELRDIQSGIKKVDGSEISMLLSPVDKTLRVMGCAGKEFEIFSTNGSKVAEGKLADQTSTIDLSSLESGIYILKVNNSTLKFTKK